MAILHFFRNRLQDGIMVFQGEVMKTLDEIRQDIDAVDRQMASLYEKRMNAAREVAAYKKAHDLPVLDQAREAAVIEKNLAYLSNPEYAGMYEDFLHHLMGQSRTLQQSMLSQGKAAYCGTEGAFAHMVCEKLFPGMEKRGYASFRDVFEAVSTHQVEAGVIPLENSSSGLVGEVMDCLWEWPVYITEAFDQHIEQCLLGLPEASLKDIETVYSKDQALWQSAQFLEALHCQTVAYPNTALAAQYVSKTGDKRLAAIGARENASLYGLKVLASRIESVPSNTTRFLVICASPNKQPGSHLGLMVSVFSEVGSLGRIIDILGSFGINMDTLQSRPIKSRPFEYFFFIQGTGRLDGAMIREMNELLSPVCAKIKWLGSYDLKKEEPDGKDLPDGLTCV